MESKLYIVKHPTLGSFKCDMMDVLKNGGKCPVTGQLVINPDGTFNYANYAQANAGVKA